MKFGKFLPGESTWTPEVEPEVSLLAVPTILYTTVAVENSQH